MTESNLVHDTFVIHRQFSTSPSQVYAAFADADKKRRWFAEGKSHYVLAFEMDFRVGGVASTMAFGEKTVSSSHVAFEILPCASGATFICTHQAVFFEGADGPQIRRAGMDELLNRLVDFLKIPGSASEQR